MHALSVVRISGGETEILPGSLMPVPGELTSFARLQIFCRSPLGWGKCDLGYAFYKFTLHDGSECVIPGIRLVGETKPKRCPPDYPIVFSREQIQRFAQEILEQDGRVAEIASAELRALTHDLRAISNEIYNTGMLLKDDISSRNVRDSMEKTETVIAAQQMMKIRLDIVDYSTGQFQTVLPDKIGVYKKCDKVVRTLRHRAAAKSIAINLVAEELHVGLIFGPPIFELIPYVLIQNAIKYSPPGMEIDVLLSKDDEFSHLLVTSCGPKIADDERSRIFERGYRGVEAVDSGETGTGLGLYAARNMVQDDFGGEIAVEQDPHVTMSGLYSAYRTTFRVSIPLAD